MEVILASFSGHSQVLSHRFYLTVVEKNLEEAWYDYYVMGRKWWTQLVCNVDSVL